MCIACARNSNPAAYASPLCVASATACKSLPPRLTAAPPMPDSAESSSSSGWIGTRSAGEESEAAPNSLFLEIIDWMLAPLLLLWPISIAVTNHYAHQIADQPYDIALVDSVHNLSQYFQGSHA